MMIRFLKNLARDEAGATAIEYALIAALISVAIIAGATSIGASLSGTFTTVGNSL
jgi:pilus assembly protein Flp/PilA